jgi:hypothetical protein
VKQPSAGSRSVCATDTVFRPLTVSKGILVTLYVLCLDALIPQLKKKAHRNWAIFHIVYTTVIVILIGTGTASNSRLAQLYWINNRNYPGGIPELINTVHLPELVWGWTVFVIASWLQDAYVVSSILLRSLPKTKLDTDLPMSCLLELESVGLWSTNTELLRVCG